MSTRDECARMSGVVHKKSSKSAAPPSGTAQPPAPAARASQETSKPTAPPLAKSTEKMQRGSVAAKQVDKDAAAKQASRFLK